MSHRRSKHWKPGIIFPVPATWLLPDTLHRIQLSSWTHAQIGAFSQRHAVFHDHGAGRARTPLANLAGCNIQKGSLLIGNSPLGEYAAMGFEYGISTTDPHALVIWEAQFGDFANTAQVIIDN